MLEAAAQHQISAGAFRLKDLYVDTELGVVSGPGGYVHLEPRVMAVLQALACHAGGLVSRRDLLSQIWTGADTYDEALTQSVYQLRQQLARAGGSTAYRDLIATVPKRGYLLKSEVTASNLEPVQTPVDVAAPAEPTKVAPTLSSPSPLLPILFGIALLIAVVATVLTLWVAN
jgi:DNA-binding winged helix-turn-helix (wHTH) protein